MAGFDAWDEIGAVVGAGALSYLAAGKRKNATQPTLRISLDKGNSLIGDVRFIGGLAAGFASRSKSVSAKTAKMLETAATASFSSLASTEAVRYQLIKQQLLPQSGRVFPSFGGVSSPQPQYGARSAAWANG